MLCRRYEKQRKSLLKNVEEKREKERKQVFHVFCHTQLSVCLSGYLLSLVLLVVFVTDYILATIQALG